MPIKYIATTTNPGEVWELSAKGRQPYYLVGVHTRSVCSGPGDDVRPCVLHNPTGHHMKEWLLHYRDDRNIFERICDHGIGHPDPDQFAYWDAAGMDGEGVHGCDGCCSPPTYIETEPIDMVICADSDCRNILFEGDDGEFCEGCERDEWGVKSSECECYMGTADNTDVMVCDHHLRVWSKNRSTKSTPNRWDVA